jgi:hypothetical protein
MDSALNSLLLQIIYMEDMARQKKKCVPIHAYPYSAFSKMGLPIWSLET